MAKFVMFGNQKGGVGKSQCTIMAATALASDPFSKRILVNDADMQQSISNARRMDNRDMPNFDRPVFYLESDPVIFFADSSPAYDEQFDVVFLDTAGKLDTDETPMRQEVARALMYMDYLFIPFTPGAFSMHASIPYIELVKQVREKRHAGRPLHVYAFLNMADRTNAAKWMAEDIEALCEAAGIRMMTSSLNRYSSFAEADTFRSMYQAGSADRAGSNFREWMDEFFRIIEP
jgi:cellulose biosynthesis protein BcsQ